MKTVLDGRKVWEPSFGIRKKKYLSLSSFVTESYHKAFEAGYYF